MDPLCLDVRTADGRRLLTAAAKTADRELQTLLADLSPQALDTLARSLRLLLRASLPDDT